MELLRSSGICSWTLVLTSLVCPAVGIFRVCSSRTGLVQFLQLSSCVAPFQQPEALSESTRLGRPFKSISQSLPWIARSIFHFRKSCIQKEPLLDFSSRIKNSYVLSFCQNFVLFSLPPLSWGCHPIAIISFITSYYLFWTPHPHFFPPMKTEMFKFISWNSFACNNTLPFQSSWESSDILPCALLWKVYVQIKLSES